MTHRYRSTGTVVSKYISHPKEGSEVKQHIMPGPGRRGDYILYGRVQHVSFQYGTSFMSSFASLEF